LRGGRHPSILGGAAAKSRIVLDGPPQKLRQNANVKEFDLGLTELGSRRSYRDVKHDKRRKRWL